MKMPSYYNHYSENLLIVQMDCIDITMDLTIILYKYCAKITKCRESAVWFSSTLGICLNILQIGDYKWNFVYQSLALQQVNKNFT